jgi:hypothetical protein
MARGKRFSAEQVITKLRQIEVQVATDKSLALACKEAGISEQIIIESWQGVRRPSQALGPPAPSREKRGGDVRF